MVNSRCAVVIEVVQDSKTYDSIVVLTMTNSERLPDHPLSGSDTSPQSLLS